jgi:HK97 family phage major capsid protein
MTTREILSRQAAVEAEMRSIHTAHPDGALDGAAESRWSALVTEHDGLKAAAARQSMLDEADRRSAGTPLNGGTDKHLDAELRNFSVVRAMAGAAGLAVDWSREREIGAEVARRSGRTFEGICVPMAALSGPVEQRVFTTTNPGTGPGSNLIQTSVLGGQFIDKLRAALVIRQLGATVLSGLVGNVAIPRLKADATGGWVAENAPVSASDPGTDQVTLSPKHAGAIIEFSRNMLLQSSPDIEQIVRGDLAAVLAQTLDQAAINGTGASNQPKGIMNTAGIGNVAMGTNGLALTYACMADLMGTVADANAETGSLAYLTNTKVRRAAAKLVDSQGRPLGTDVVFQSMPRAFTNNVPANLTKGTSSGICSAALYGNWADLLIGVWSELDILVNPYESTAYPKGNVQVRAMLTCDVSVRHPESFGAILDILA